MGHGGNDSKSSGFAIDFLLGGLAGAIDKTITAPLERVKLIIQTQDANPRIRSGEVPRYTGIVNCFVRVYKEQGFLSFWRGNFTNIVRYFPTQAFNFAFKDGLKKIFPQYNHQTEFFKFFLVQLASGAIAGAGSLSIVYPLDYARTRLASDVGEGKRDFKGLGDCMKKTYQGQGIRGLYNGFGVSVAGIIPYRGVYFGLYDALREKNPYKNDRGFVGVLSTYLLAQCTSIVAGYASYPFDTVRRRLHMQSEKPKEQWVYKGTVDCFKKIFRDEGTLAFFKGAWANAVRTVGSAMVLVMYDQMQAFINKK
eukprot:TRINITY_DN2726_c0_g1_i1.p1 TRINITY_DN2726_c0_g1~~TRINITY_DN2726_c0_g1_i1.p1  ORF type:complete len:309 (+),score=66.09 TRINITY_DN2726_c0_g1_i1:23-949(+)